MSKKEQLTCTTQDKNESFTMKQVVKATFDKDTIEHASFELDYELKNLDMLESIKNSVHDSFKKYENETGISIQEEQNGSIYQYKLIFNPKKIDKNILYTFGLIGDNKLAVSDNLTGDGYVCKGW